MLDRQSDQLQHVNLSALVQAVQDSKDAAMVDKFFLVACQSVDESHVAFVD